MCLNLLKSAHSAIICGATGCGKTEFVLDLLETEYKDVFDHIVIVCPLAVWNKAYRQRTWIENVKKPVDARVQIVNPIGEDGQEYLQELLGVFFKKYAGSETLYIVDDCSSTKQMKKKADTLSMLAFSGRHASQSVWVLTQRYNSVCKDLRSQIKWCCLFFTKDKFSFQECLDENNVIEDVEDRKRISELLSQHKHSKVILITEQPTSYKFVK